MNVIEEQLANSEVRSDLVSMSEGKGFHVRFLKGASPDLDAVLRLRYQIGRASCRERVCLYV